ncbi:response regulator transcription factor [Cohnella hongkongensis]|uniref:Response regulator n=1 Tax=Cohnella hongkongensis TaxID=178337 RepID=A0ABV9FA71_9BACL
MIVDDEVIIRNGLCTVIDWKELGLELVPPAASAEEALERIPEERPDILLTDIRMSGMDGIELAKEVKAALPDAEVIILTGYDDFSYAQQALRGGVTDYLLKTSRPEEIIKAALKAKQNIVEKRELLRQERRQLDELNKQTLMKLLNKALPEAGAAEFDRIRDWLRRRGDGRFDGGGAARVAIVSASGWGGQRFEDLLIGAVDNMMNELLTCITLADRERLVVVLREEAEAGGEAALPRALKRVGQILKCETFAAIGSPTNRFEEWPESYAEAERIYSFKGLIGGSGLFSSEDLKGRTGGRTLCSDQEEAELSAILMSGDATGLRHWTNRTVRAQVENPTATPATLQAYLRSVVLAGFRWLERTRTGEAASPQTPHLPADPVYDWGGRPEDEVFKSLSAVMAAYREAMDRNRFSYIRKAIDYIREHLDQPLSLQQVAGFVHSNPNHFSEVFKRETGMTYLEFVTRERMRKAAEMLHGTPIKVAEIAHRVGYVDIKYFTQQFKKHTGKTPSEYRQSPKEAEY